MTISYLGHEIQQRRLFFFSIGIYEKKHNRHHNQPVGLSDAHRYDFINSDDYKKGSHRKD